MSTKSQNKKPKFTPEEKVAWKPRLTDEERRRGVVKGGSKFVRVIPSTEYERFRNSEGLYKYDNQGRRLV